MSDRSPHIEVTGLTLERGARTVLASVDAAFPRRQVTAVVGPSGAGKTSLLRCLNRLEEPDEGRVTLDGIDIRRLDPPRLRRRVGMIFQAPVLFEGGVKANLEYGMEQLPASDLEEALERAGLGGAFLSRESTALSMGQAQRVCIARALLRRPEALLMDEPTSALDRTARSNIEHLIASLAEAGLTVVLVTHDLAQARRLASGAVLLVGGRVRAAGDPAELEALWDTETSR